MTTEERQKVEDVVIDLNKILQEEEDLKESRFNFRLFFCFINKDGLYSHLKSDELDSFTADCVMFYYSYWPKRELFRKSVIIDLKQETNCDGKISLRGSDGDIKLKLDELEPYLLKLLSEVDK